MFQFRRFPSYNYPRRFHCMMTMYYHRRIAPFGYPRILTPICGSPWLFAAYRVLLRLPVPRHSPCALSNLTFLSQLIVDSWQLTVSVSLRDSLTINYTLSTINWTFLSAICSSFLPTPNTSLYSRIFALLLTSSHFPLFNFQGARRNSW